MTGRGARCVALTQIERGLGFLDQREGQGEGLRLSLLVRSLAGFWEMSEFGPGLPQ